MKNILQTSLFLLTLIIFLSSCVSNKTNKQPESKTKINKVEDYKLKPGIYDFDSSLSSIEWVGKKPTGSHNGDISLKRGSIKIDSSGSISGGKFIFDMQTINCTDLEGKPKANIEGHLKNEDFFDVEKFPEAFFIIKDVDNTKMSGILTIKNIPNPISFNYEMTGPLEFKAEIKVDRSLYNIKYASKSFFSDLGDKFIDDIFTITLNPVKFK